MLVESIFVPYVDLDVRALNGGRRPRLTGAVLEMTVYYVGAGEAILVRTATTGEGYAGFRRSPGAATHVALVFDADGQQARFDFAL